MSESSSIQPSKGPVLFTAKYVVIRVQGLEVPVILPERGGIPHADAAKIGEPIAAGFCMLHTLGDGALGFSVEGMSLSLHKVSRTYEDARLLDKYYLQRNTQVTDAQRSVE